MCRAMAAVSLLPRVSLTSTYPFTSSSSSNASGVSGQSYQLSASSSQALVTAKGCVALIAVLSKDGVRAGCTLLCKINKAVHKEASSCVSVAITKALDIFAPKSSIFTHFLHAAALLQENQVCKWLPQREELMKGFSGNHFSLLPVSSNKVLQQIVLGASSVCVSFMNLCTCYEDCRHRLLQSPGLCVCSPGPECCSGIPSWMQTVSGRQEAQADVLYLSAGALLVRLGGT